MNKRFVVTALVATVGLCACQAQLSKPKIEDVIQSVTIGSDCRQNTIGEEQTVFSQGIGSICFHIDIQPQIGRLVRADVRAIETPIWNNQVIYKKVATLRANSEDMRFTLTRNAGWPKGTYQIEILVDDQLQITKEYSIQ